MDVVVAHLAITLGMIVSVAFVMVGSTASDSGADFLQVVGIYLGLGVIGCLMAISDSRLVIALRSK